MIHYSFRKTGTYADTLEAIGRATLIEEIGAESSPLIIENGAVFQIEWQEAADTRCPSPGYPYIWVRQKEPDRPGGPSVLDYELERKKRDARRAWEEAERRTHTHTQKAPEAREVSRPEPPSPEFGLGAILASMRAGWLADLDLFKWLSENPDRALAWASARLSGKSFSDEPSVSNSQILNPVAGKGVSAPKTESRSWGSIPRHLIDPFAEWMKIRGVWTAMLAYRVDNDFKFYVIEPRNIRVLALVRVRSALRQLNLKGRIRLDIEITLRCAEVLVGYTKGFSANNEEPVEDEEILTFDELLGKSPADVIIGLRHACFTRLGRATALMNDSFLPLPDWFKIGDRIDADDYIRLIHETIGSAPGRVSKQSYGCLASLGEARSDDSAILRRFRAWLLTGQIDELLEFHVGFAAHLMRRFGANEFARAFSTTYLDTLLTKGFAMKDIVEDPGFLSVARALRNATIYAVRGVTPFDVRFGLAQKWKREINTSKAAFVAQLSEFVQVYNWENIHRRQSHYHLVDAEHLDQVIALIEAHGADLIGSLLLAYGYAYRPKETDVKADTAKDVSSV